MNLTIHRGSHEIGGSCVELASENSRIIIDTGLPLSVTGNEDYKALIPATLFDSLELPHPPLGGILISHPHQDHYGLLEHIKPNIPLYAGSAASELIKLTYVMQGKHNLFSQPITFKPEESFKLGDFTITPYLVDHSGFDSYAFLIECDGKKVFYSGDFREHGRKGKLFKLLKYKLPRIDMLLLEGTMVGQERNDILSETQLEERFEKSIKKTEGIVFVTLSSQNIDRIVTIFRACKKSGRNMIIDPYTAEILDKLKNHYILQRKKCNIPHPSWPEIHVCFPKELCEWMKRNGNKQIVQRYNKYGKRWEYFSKNASKFVMFVRPSATEELINKNYFDLSKARWIYSLWEGYIEKDPKTAKFASQLKNRGVTFEHLHTSGHADVATLKELVDITKPKKIIPIHTTNPYLYKNLFPNVVEASDGIPIDI